MQQVGIVSQFSHLVNGLSSLHLYVGIKFQSKYGSVSEPSIILFQVSILFVLEQSL